MRVSQSNDRVQFYSEELAVEDRLERLLLKLGVRVTFFDTTPLGTDRKSVV